jgi:hypothetical protein
MSGLRYVKKIFVGFNPLDTAGRGAREFLRQVSAAPSLATNPKTEVKTEIFEEMVPARVLIEFDGGEKLAIDDAGGVPATDILDDMGRISASLHMKEMAK